MVIGASTSEPSLRFAFLLFYLVSDFLLLACHKPVPIAWFTEPFFFFLSLGFLSYCVSFFFFFLLTFFFTFGIGTVSRISRRFWTGVVFPLWVFIFHVFITRPVCLLVFFSGQGGTRA